jgi:hypothetical protein
MSPRLLLVHALAALLLLLLPRLGWCADAGLRDEPIIGALPAVYIDDSAWAWTVPSLPNSVPATVPGDIITDLERAGVIPDPFVDSNWLAINATGIWDGPVTLAVNFSAAFPPLSQYLLVLVPSLLPAFFRCV